MAWYYKDGKQEKGPISKAELQALINAKKLNAGTLMRAAQSDQWRPLGEMVGKKSQANEASPHDSDKVQQDSAGSDAAPVSAEPQQGDDIADEKDQSNAVCSQCGRSFPQDQVVSYDDKVICAACKPMFVQKLKEGASLPTTLKYAGFWIRFVAKFIDGLIMAAVQWAILIPIGLMMSPISGGTGTNAMVILQQIIGIVLQAAYATFFIGRFGATLGKMACQLRVVMPEGEKVSYMRALGRHFAEFISAIILGIGYIMAGFDSEKRALHDRICSTRVVRK